MSLFWDIRLSRVVVLHLAEALLKQSGMLREREKRRTRRRRIKTRMKMTTTMMMSRLSGAFDIVVMIAGLALLKSVMSCTMVGLGLSGGSGRKLDASCRD